MATRAGLCQWLVPDGIFAVRVTFAGEEHLAPPGFAFQDVTLLAFRALHSGIFRFFQGLDVFAIRVAAAANKFSVASGSYNQVGFTFRTAAPFNHFRCGAFLVFTDIACVFAIRVAGTSRKKPPLPRLICNCLPHSGHFSSIGFGYGRS